MKAPDGMDTVNAADRDEWRSWLASHHTDTKGVWLVLHKRASSQASVTYDEAVEEALCFGWIDSRARTLDDTRYLQVFTPRKPGSVWAATNKVRVERLICEGRMTPIGLAIIEAAKADGSWDALNHVDALEFPDDLLGALAANAEAQRYFDAFPDSAKRAALFWVTSAKRPETRARRIAETVELASRNVRAPENSRPATQREKTPA